MTENFDKIVKFKKKRLWDFFPYRPPLAKGDQTHTPLSPLQPPPGPWLCPRNAISHPCPSGGLCTPLRRAAKQSFWIARTAQAQAEMERLTLAGY